MIIIALIIVTILFFVSCNLFLKNKAVHDIATVISSLLLLSTIVFSILNFHDHYGMHLVNQTRTEKLASMSPKQPMLVYEKLGSARKHSIVLYKHRANGKLIHTRTDVSVKNRFVSTNATKPALKIIHHRYVYHSKAARFWFRLPQKSQTKWTENCFYVPKNWTILSANQAKVLKKSAKVQAKAAKKEMASPQVKAQVKQKAQTYVQTRMVKALRKDPKMSSTKKRTLTKKFMKAFQTHMKQKAMQTLMQKALTKAKHAPVGYATK